MRRNDVTQMTDAEVAITNAMADVEKMGAHPHLTDAVVLLQRARDAVADFVDGKPRAPTECTCCGAAHPDDDGFCPGCGCCHEYPCGLGDGAGCCHDSDNHK